jgi:diacylglycerol kinase family enzyme
LCSAQGQDLAVEVRRAIEAKPDAIVAAGGDGTVSAVASALAGSDIPLGVLPTGTLNHFAKDLGIPLRLEDAARVIGAGSARHIDIATVNGRTFINNSSIGIYPHIVQKRDEIRERLGRGKWSAMLRAFLTVFTRYPTVHVRINSPTIAFERNTPFVFVGNNHYEISLNMLGKRPALDGHELCVYFPQPHRALWPLAAGAPRAVRTTRPGEGF